MRRSMAFRDIGENPIVSQRALVARHAQGTIARVDQVCARLRTAGIDKRMIAAVRGDCFAIANSADAAGKAQAKLVELEREPLRVEAKLVGVLDWIKRKFQG